jgi:ABC-type cobalamin/Fe3+-siderophores transport system ATPase subunit
MMGRYGALGLFRRPGLADLDAVEAALRRVDAFHLSDRPLGLLSGGERQRVNLARALAQQPDILLLDEPTTFLDAESQAGIVDTIRELHESSGLTTLVVSHDPNVVSALCEETIRMSKGRVLAADGRRVG